MTLLLNLEGTSTPIAGAVFTAFDLDLRNNGGSLQHRIQAPNTSTAPIISSPFATLINGATHTFINTPTGPDASTGFAGGAKVGNPFTHVLYFDTPEQTLGDAAMITNIKQTTNGSTALNVEAQFLETTINGFTRRWLTFVFYNAVTGGGISLNTTTLGTGEFIRVECLGYLKP
jgi:hypothetical protein